MNYLNYMPIKTPGENTEMASMLILCDGEVSLVYSNVTMPRVGGGGMVE